jgi:hypothetical protein
VLVRAGIVLLGFLTSTLATAQKATDITPNSIVGIKLGTTQARSRTLLAKPVRLDRLEEGYVRFVSGRQKVEVYFRTGSSGVVAVTTWSKLLRTGKRVGPCSSIASLQRAYGATLKPFRRGGRVVAYRSGNLIFTVGNRSRVGVVALGRDPAAVYVALNAPACS